jgi:hypothetical protein
MKRFLAVVALLALMAGFAFGVNRFFATRKASVSNIVNAPTTTTTIVPLPGTMFVAQHGAIYSLTNGTFTDLHLTPSAGTWMQPALVPGTGNILAVARATAFSEVYLLDANGNIIQQLSHNGTKSSTIQLNHWMFWPRVAADGDTFYVSYDAPKSTGSYQIDYAVWKGSLTGKLVQRQWTSPNGYTGGDVWASPITNGELLYSKYEISNGQVYSQLAIQSKALLNPVILTQPVDDCGEPAVSPDGTQVAMLCAGGTGLQSANLEVASLTGSGAKTVLGTPKVLVHNCLCAAPAWAPDGTGLVYYEPTDASGHFQLWWIAGAATALAKPPVQVTTGDDFDATSPPAWGMTGGSVASASPSQSPSGSASPTQ